jgi:hypothetical protein
MHPLLADQDNLVADRRVGHGREVNQQVLHGSETQDGSPTTSDQDGGARHRPRQAGREAEHGDAGPQGTSSLRMRFAIAQHSSGEEILHLDQSCADGPERRPYVDEVPPGRFQQSVEQPPGVDGIESKVRVADDDAAARDHELQIGVARASGHSADLAEARHLHLYTLCVLNSAEMRVEPFNVNVGVRAQGVEDSGNLRFSEAEPAKAAIDFEEDRHRLAGLNGGPDGLGREQCRPDPCSRQIRDVAGKVRSVD